jgi:hypothetical protein
MRRSLLVLGLLLVPLTGAGAAHAQLDPVLLRTPGAQGFEISGGNGRAVVTRVGAIFLDVRLGRVRVVDLPGGRAPFHRCSRAGRRVSPTTVEYRGAGLSCRIYSRRGGPWQVVMRGRGISASGVVRGSLTLDAAARGPLGTFTIGDRAERTWPRHARTYVLRRA